MSIKKRPNVISDVISAAEKGLLIPSRHAEKQMTLRDVQMSDIEEMLFRSKREDNKDCLTKDRADWKYAIRGVNDNGDKDIRVIVVFDDPETVIVTVIGKNKPED